MSRSCTICQHPKRPQIDRRLGAGEPTAQLACDYDVSVSSLYRHRRNCLKLAPSRDIQHEAARGSAALALLPGREAVAGQYLQLCERIDQIVQQAQAQNSLTVALNGLNSIKRTLDSVSRLAGHDRPLAEDAHTPSQGGATLDLPQIAARLIGAFDHEPEIKARIAKVLVDWDDERAAIPAPSTPVSPSGIAVTPSSPAQAPDCASTRAAAVASMPSAPATTATPAAFVHTAGPQIPFATPSPAAAHALASGGGSVTAPASSIATTPTAPVLTGSPAMHVMGATGGTS